MTNNNLTCKHCSTHIDSHGVGDCADAWLWQLIGHKVDITEQNGRSFYYFVHGRTEILPLTTDYNVFFREVVPKLIPYWEAAHISKEIEGQMGYLYSFIILNEIHGTGSTFLEAGFRAAVKFLSEKNND